MVVRGGAQAELEEDRVDVRLDRPRAEEEPAADALVGEPFGHQGEHLALARRQLVDRALVVLPAEQLRDHDRVDRRAAAADAPDAVEKVVDLEHAVLEQVAESLCALGEERQRVLRLDDLREQEHGGLRAEGADLARGPRPFVRVRGRHAHVDQRDVRPLAGDGVEERAGVAELRCDLEAAVCQDVGQALPQQDGVLGDHDPHGITASTRVPPPERLSTVSRPPSASTRSASRAGPSRLPAWRRRCRRPSPRARADRRRLGP